MSLSRETQRQLWRDLIDRCAIPGNRPPTIMWPLTVALTVLALYAFSQL